MVRLFTLEFGTATCGENLQCREVFICGLHGLGVQYCQVPNRPALCGHHRNADIAFCANLPQPEIFWKFLRQATNGGANMPAATR